MFDFTRSEVLLGETVPDELLYIDLPFVRFAPCEMNYCISTWALYYLQVSRMPRQTRVGKEIRTCHATTPRGIIAKGIRRRRTRG